LLLGLGILGLGFPGGANERGAEQEAEREHDGAEQVHRWDPHRWDIRRQRLSHTLRPRQANKTTDGSRGLARRESAQKNIRKRASSRGAGNYATLPEGSTLQKPTPKRQFAISLLCHALDWCKYSSRS